MNRNDKIAEKIDVFGEVVSENLAHLRKLEIAKQENDSYKIAKHSFHVARTNKILDKIPEKIISLNC